VEVVDVDRDVDLVATGVVHLHVAVADKVHDRRPRPRLVDASASFSW